MARVGFTAAVMMLIPLLIAAVKITAGILVLHYGKRYAKSIEEEAY